MKIYKSLIFIWMLSILISGPVYAACTWEGNTGTVASPYASEDVNDCVNDASSRNDDIIINIPESNPTWTVDGGVSTTPLTVATGTQTLEVASGLEFTAGYDIVLKYDDSHYMIGTITSYSGTTLVCNITSATGASTPGPYNSWTVTQGHGVTINMSSGFANVTSLTIKGESKTGAIINNPRWDVTTKTSKKFRLTNMSFAGTQQMPGGNAVVIFGDTKPSLGGGFRIDNLNINMTNNVNARIVNVYSSDAAGLIDSNYIEYNRQTFIVVGKSNTPWADADTFGTSDAVYFENNIVINNDVAAGGFVHMFCDSDYGGRVVVRYNSITNLFLGGHDNLGPARSNRSWEIYNNRITFTGTNTNGAFFVIRGGSGYVYNNYLESTVATNPTAGPISLNNYRSYSSAPYCDSTPEYICVNSGHSASACTTETDCGGTAGVTTYCQQRDGHQDSTGWPCRDQIGRGQNQSSRPALFWNNTAKWASGSAFTVTPTVSSGATSHIQLDREYCNHDTSTTCGGVSSSYTAYTCPHPLTGLTGSCATTGETMYGTTGYNFVPPTISGGISISGGSIQ
jgi:hypothetical protein